MGIVESKYELVGALRLWATEWRHQEQKKDLKLVTWPLEPFSDQPGYKKFYFEDTNGARLPESARVSSLDYNVHANSGNIFLRTPVKER